MSFSLKVFGRTSGRMNERVRGTHSLRLLILAYSLFLLLFPAKIVFKSRDEKLEEE
jgi:hypothetical protein